MNENVIFLKLNEHFRKVQKYYPIESIFGIFVTDVQENAQKIKTMAVIVPPFEQICTSLEPINKTIEEDIQLFDIRLTYEATKNGFNNVINALYTDYIIVNPKYEHTFIKLYKSQRDAIKAGSGLGIPSAELKVAITKLCRYTWNEESSVVSFIKQLTDAEKTAIACIVNTVGDEGTFSQAKIATAAGISRVTMTKLVGKLSLAGVAETMYLGKSGTFIKIIDDTLLNIKGL